MNRWFSFRYTVVLFLLLVASLAGATIIEKIFGTDTAWRLIYGAFWFVCLWGLFAINLIGNILLNKLYQNFPVFLFHLAFIVILFGAVASRSYGVEGLLNLREGQESDLIVTSKGYNKLPFKVKLDNFKISRYPGVQSPSGFESHITLTDSNRQIILVKCISMNRVLSYRGYRLYQNSYHPDEKGSVLTISHDPLGMTITYFGYALMCTGMLLSLLVKSTRFRQVSAKLRRISLAKKVLISVLVIFSASGPIWAKGPPSGRMELSDLLLHAQYARQLLVLNQSGRIEPFNTLASNVLRKIYRKTSYHGMTAEEVFLCMMANPEHWSHEPLIKLGSTQIGDILQNHNAYLSLADFFKNDQYLLSSYVEVAYQKPPVKRSKFDQVIIRLDERINIAYMVASGELFRLPSSVDSLRLLYMKAIKNSYHSGDWYVPNLLLRDILNNQSNTHKEYFPSKGRISAEIFLNTYSLLFFVEKFYGLAGILLLILQLIQLYLPRYKLKILINILICLVISAFILQSIYLTLRGYVAGHAPWSNGYESLVFVAWATLFAGLIFLHRSLITFSATAVLACCMLFVAHLGWMDPQITNLVPVLQSYWLVIHVAAITSGYGFLATSAIMGLLSLLMMIARNQQNGRNVYLTLQEFSCIIEMSMIIGLYLMSSGTVTGAIWANETWGRYWGWDPKETWALITILVYAFILHMRLVKGLRGIFAFHTAALVGFASVMMTYFGVNYILTGLHSYASGDSAKIPGGFYFAIVGLAVLIGLAYIQYRRHNCESQLIKH
jgi:cytochrome c-type biogenesis protein CcsB